MSSENQQNTSNSLPQEHEKMKNRLADIITICLPLFSIFILAFIILYFISLPENIFRHAELFIIFIFLCFLLLLTTHLAFRTKTNPFKKLTSKISSNSIFNLIILSCFISACTFNSLIDTSNDIIKEIEAKNMQNEVKNEIKKSKCEINSQIKELKIDIKNKVKVSQIKTQNDNIVIQTVKENQVKNNVIATQKIQQNEDINRVNNSSLKENENDITNTLEKDNDTNNGNKCDIETNHQQKIPENTKFLANILGPFGTAFFAFLSAYFFLVKGKVEDYLDSIDEKKTNTTTSPNT